MCSSRRLRRALLCAALALHARAWAAPELQLAGSQTSLFCIAPSAQDIATGLACELMREMARRVGHSGKIQFYPLARALIVASSSPDTLVAPLARVAAREDSFHWHILLFQDDFVLVTRRDATVDIDSVEAARNLAVGVMRGSAGARLAAEHGLLRPSLVVHDDLNARKLQARRIDAWLSSWNSIIASQHNAGLPVDALRRGALVSRVKIYLASSLDVEPERMKPWHAAFEAMLRDGSYRRLLKKYNFEEPAS